MTEVLTTPNKTGSAIGATTAISTAAAYLQGLGWDLTLIDWQVVMPWFAGLVGFTGYLGKAAHEKPTESDFALDMSLPVGLRNRNPGNLRPLSRNQQWRGQIGVNDGFCVFDSDLHGLRAMARNLRNQWRLHRLNTLESILTKYAPGNENDTQGYIAYVSKQTGIVPTMPIDMEANEVIVSLMIPMIRMENGQQPYSTEKIIQAVELA